MAYIKSKEDLNNHFKFEKTLVFRKKVEDYIKQCKNTDILLCSCYVWNWEITTYLAKEVKKLNPECLILFGGPQVPEDSTGFFEKHPYVDILVHGEGEYILKNIFNAYLNGKDYSNVKGISTKDFVTPPQERINDLAGLPSPYLTNLVWDLVEKIEGVKWICTWETNRGCPYQCTFCDWGSATFTKIRKHLEERLFGEIEWFGKNKIIYVDVADANFGIFQERDLGIARKFKEVALKTGFPDKIRPAWAKNSSEKIIPIANELKKGGILGAVTLAVQSLDKTTLDIIIRANIKFDKFSDLATEFRLNGIPTYTEIILGLPGETLQSYKDGLEIIAKTKLDTVFIYNCSVLPNAPMNATAYREYYKLKKIKSPIMLVHSSIHDRGMPEFEEILIGASSYTLDELKEMHLLSCAFITLQNLGILECISTYYNKVKNLPFMKFYEIFLDFCRTKDSIFSKEFKKVVEYIENGYAGKGWDHHDPNLGDINWPIEEASWLRLEYSTNNLENGMHKFLTYLEHKQGYSTSKDVLEDLVKFQIFLLTTREDTRKIKSNDFEFDWRNFFVNNIPLKHVSKRYFYKNQVLEEDLIRWGYEAIWYGRRSKKFKIYPENLEVQQDTPGISHGDKQLEKIKPLTN